jgi:hypothetical protein
MGSQNQVSLRAFFNPTNPISVSIGPIVKRIVGIRSRRGQTKEVGGGLVSPDRPDAMELKFLGFLVIR